MKKLAFSVAFCCFTTLLFGQQLWSKQDASRIEKSAKKLYQKTVIPEDFSVYNLQLEVMSSVLKTSNASSIIELPNAKGVLQRFHIKETSNLAPELAAKFPMIQSYTGYGIDDPTAVAK